LDFTVWTVQYYAMTATAKMNILHAAAMVVQNRGAAHLTVDAVAEEAKLSKGGVLYHYPNKRAMIEGMLQYLLENLRLRKDKYQEEHLGEPNLTIRSLIFAAQERDPSESAMELAILAAAAEDPSLLQPAQEHIREWFRQVQLEGPVGVVVLLANEGLRFLEMLDLLSLSTDDRSEIFNQLIKMTEESKP
jgi:AcrR family transcriptional regulator